MSINHRIGLLVLLAVVGSTQCGCITLSALMGQKKSSQLDTSLLKAQGYSVPPGGMPSPVAPSSDGKPRIVLEVRGDSRHLESIPLAMDRATFIEDIVQQAELHEELGSLSISIMRPNGSGMPPVRLETKTNGEGKTVSVGQNYALLPGDHLIVISDNRSSLERFIDKHFRNES